MHRVVDAVAALDADPAVRAIVLTGRGRAFAAGADIREMACLDQQQVSSGVGGCVSVDEGGCTCLPAAAAQTARRV
jgi:enoyl-CoA hydratase/carnithine racemase